MNSIQDRITAFAKLGMFLSQFSKNKIAKKEQVAYNDLFFEGFQHQLKLAEENNAWFTKEHLLFAIENIASSLTTLNLTEFTNSEYKKIKTSKTVGVIMAGNIPLVGFHDFLCVLLSGHSIVIKQSSNDKHLLPFLAKYLEYVCPFFKEKITFIEGKLTQFDAIIATGSNNTARYFEFYFKNKPNIIRKNRNSCAVLTGHESDIALKNLSEDIFQFFGLGCRSVSKIFVPKGYNFDLFFKGMYAKHSIINNVKYANNYDYNKAVYLMSQFNILENGFLMVKEDKNYASPIATVFYEYYDTLDALKIKLAKDKEKIQCIVADGLVKNEIPFGKTQQPTLWQYADNINTFDFLSKI